MWRVKIKIRNEIVDESINAICKDKIRRKILDKNLNDVTSLEWNC